jgi:hypothetical protein
MGQGSGMIIGIVLQIFLPMEATLNTQGQEQQAPPDTYREQQEAAGEKSELMQIFEMQVKDAYWAYKDLLRAIIENESGHTA